MTDDEALTTTLRDARNRFAELVASIRPELHRYCSRMTGSALDGEDLVQETLAQAFYGLSLLRQEVPLRPWLFTIAHHKCVDFLRARTVRSAVDLDDRNEPSVEIEAEIEDRQLAATMFSGLVLALPTRERACVVLKDVLEYSIAEIAEILETSQGAVKAALHRGREKLAALTEAEPTVVPHSEPSHVERRYIDAFNRRDWVGLQALLEDEVHCELIGHARLEGRAALGDNYLTTYNSLSYTWRMTAGQVDGEPVIVCLREEAGRWIPRHAIRLDWRADRVVRIRDYAHVGYLFGEARVQTDDG